MEFLEVTYHERKNKAFRNSLLRKALHVGATRFELATF